MPWKFWTQSTFKSARPKELPSRVGRHLVVNLKYDPDWVWALKIVTTPRDGETGIFDFRIFDADRAKMTGLDVKDYGFLDGHPDLVYFDGWYNKNTWEMEMNDLYDTIKAARPAAS